MAARAFPYGSIEEVVIRKLIVVAVVVLGGFAGADVYARSTASGEVERQVAARTEGSAGVDAKVGRPGMLLTVLIGGRVGPVDLHLDRFATQGVEVVDVDADFVGVTVDRSGIFNGQVKITHIDSVDLRFGLDGPALAELADVPVEISGGKVRATIEGVRVDVEPRLEGRVLVLRAAGAPGRVSVPMPESDLLPCIGGLSVEGDQVRISCSAKPVPDELIQRLSQ